MIFLLEYDRPTRRTLLFKTFKDEQRRVAQDERLQLELELSAQGLLLDREVVPGCSPGRLSMSSISGARMIGISSISLKESSIVILFDPCS